MSKVANAPYSPINVPIITCSICRNEQTVARSATSYTLKPWHVISYPDDCRCPKCSGIKKTPAELAEDEPPPKRKQRTQPICHAESISQQYYRAALKMGEFSSRDFKNSGLPKTHKASAYLGGLVETGKLIRTGKARFAVVKKEASQ